jgi:hypothetical protein
MIARGPRFNEETEQRNLCDPVRKIADDVPLFMEHALIPAQSAQYQIGLMITREEIRTSFQPAQDDIAIYWPSILGCVSYEFTFQKRGRHLTEFRAHLRKVNPGNQNLPLGFDTNDGNVPTGQLIIARTLAGGAVD